MNKLYAGIEVGGTKTICGIGYKDGHILDIVVIDTKSPEITFNKIVKYLLQFEICSLGIACFGPLYLKKNNKNYGTIMNCSPKVEWRNFNLLKYFKKHFPFPSIEIKIDTDVNAAALAEYKANKKEKIISLLYLTIGTGIGGGFINNNKILYGLVHPEMGHIFIQKHKDDFRNFNGICPIHNNCLEGMASGKAISNRWKVKHCSELHTNHIAWDIEAEYLAQALIQYILILSPHKIVLGGGIMQQRNLYNKIRAITRSYLKNYLYNEIETFITHPILGKNSGVVGAIILGSL